MTVASNLPEGDASAGAQGKSETALTKERVNYEVSETQREIVRGPGAVRRMTVAVMVDGVVSVAADGTRTWTPRPDDELAVLRELVASAVGLDAARGDVLTLKSLEFQELPIALGTEGGAGLLDQIGAFDLLSLVQTAVLAVVAMVLGLFVLRPILIPARNQPALAAPGLTLALPPIGGFSGAALDGELGPGFEISTMTSFDSTDQDAPEQQDPASRLRRLIEQRQTESIEILRGWMEHEEEPA